MSEIFGPAQKTNFKYVSVYPSYYRQPGEIYPPDAIVCSKNGSFSLEIERYLGQSGADSAIILDKDEVFRDRYAPFVRYRNKHEFVDYTRPYVSALETTFLTPLSIGKKILNPGKKSNILGPIVAFLCCLTIFASFYIVVRDSKIIANSYKLICRSKNIRNYLNREEITFGKDEKDSTFKSLNKIARLREKIYARTLKSAIVSLTITITIVALSALAITAAIIGTYPLVIGAGIGIGLMALGLGIKTAVEWNGRLDRQNAKNILTETEHLRLMTRMKPV